MNALATVGVIVGYLLIGVLICRIFWRSRWRGDWLDDEKDLLFIPLILWGVLLPIGAVVAAGWGLVKLATIPTKPERIRAKIERQQQRITELERELGLR